MVEDKELTLHLKSISKCNKWKTGIGELEKNVMYFFSSFICVINVLL